ncbi:MAG: PadR family transcriptional regulator [Eubacteriales bacterium]
MPESKNALTEAVYYILLALMQPLHGYGIMQEVTSFSGGRVNLGAGTLYGALNTLVAKGWIEALSAKPKDRKKEYVITDLGKAVVAQEIARLEELVKNGTRVLGGEK